ncbi:unnamed protein product, partial [Amoebophrya sp. A25]
ENGRGDQDEDQQYLQVAGTTSSTGVFDVDHAPPGLGESQQKILSEEQEQEEHQEDDLDVLKVQSLGAVADHLQESLSPEARRMEERLRFLESLIAKNEKVFQERIKEQEKRYEEFVMQKQMESSTTEKLEQHAQGRHGGGRAHSDDAENHEDEGLEDRHHDQAARVSRRKEDTSCDLNRQNLQQEEEGTAEVADLYDFSPPRGSP